jgi:guanyl-specific ribonuclease Sa
VNRFVVGLSLVGVLLVGCGPQSDGAEASGARPDPTPVAAAAGSSCPAPSATTPGAAESRLPVRSMCALPKETISVYAVITRNGRTSYPQDGGTFGNYEKLLPRHERGYYREYTVPTPGSRDRGARRLISGNGRELYYTGDHYNSFVVVDPNARVN